MTWFKITPTSTSDQKCFPKIKDLVGKLLLFDLGYWSYGLLGTLDTAGAYFLSRVKSKSVILIEAVVDGLSSCYVGHNLSEIDFKRKRGNIIELMGRVPYGETGLALKVIGFWNKDKKCYHWYCTNLDIEAKLIYPLYRLRWQCELIFKGCKNSLNANQITSNNKNIIESLILASLAAHLITASVVEVARHELSEEKMDAISFQRVAKVLVLLASDFVNFLTTSSKRYLTILLDKLKRFAKELYDPNYKRRKTSLGAMKELLEPFG